MRERGGEKEYSASARRSTSTISTSRTWAWYEGSGDAMRGVTWTCAVRARDVQATLHAARSMAGRAVTRAR